MAIARITVKGQVTIPHDIRAALDVKGGDSVMFVIEGNRVVLIPVRRRSLSELYGSLHVDKRFPAGEERRAAQEHVAKHVVGAMNRDED